MSAFEDRQEIYRKHGCEEGKCEIFEIESLSRQKRSVDSPISFSLKRYGFDTVLNLRKSDGILAGNNTPVFFGKFIGSEMLLEKQLGISFRIETP
ncbi:hypothetical protein KQX54_002432 [Cotesia glomerata]|uniref:Uncharacterized protein n=1 Tax=Cotesia glomerata TaxID=32391 RepID=A0AAV7HW58_COTGL|nr:hypothetical protein KQX54_002432 [Cotesia glomerata]